jgi:hypothetical protein
MVNRIRWAKNGGFWLMAVPSATVDGAPAACPFERGDERRIAGAVAVPRPRALAPSREERDGSAAATGNERAAKAAVGAKVASPAPDRAPLSRPTRCPAGIPRRRDRRRE